MFLTKNLLLMLCVATLLVAGGCISAFFLISDARTTSEIVASYVTDPETQQRLESIEVNCGIATNILFISFVLLLNVVAQLIAKCFKMKREQDRALS
jgi:capsular polysaccharide biosynthesis protein